MSTEHHLTGMDELAAIIARILIGGFFAFSGANNLLSISDATARAIEAGVPAASFFVFITALVKCILGILIIIRLQSKIAAFILAWYTLISSFLFYGPGQWETFPMAEQLFLRNIAMLGGLLYLYAHSRGFQEVAAHKPARTRRKRNTE